MVGATAEWVACLQPNYRRHFLDDAVGSPAMNLAQIDFLKIVATVAKLCIL